jgi:Beta-galactosidase/Glycosyl hydrolase family 53
MRRGIYLITLAAVLAAVTAVPAEAAKRKVPFGFFGTVVSNSQVERLPDAALDAEMARMARSGVESIRLTVSWAAIERAQGTFDFAATDRLVGAAARHGIDVLPIVMSTPRWASSRPSHGRYNLFAPKDPRLYANFLRVLIARYGPRGNFWPAAGIRPVPIRAWQIWNEQAADFFWATRPWPRSYVRLLRAAYRAVHRADRRAAVIAGSLTGVSGTTPWGQLRRLYRAGAKGLFDAVSVHFFSVAPSVRLTALQTAKLAQLVRREMRRHRDRLKKVWFTELTWTAAAGKVPKREQLGFETTPRGQAARLRSVFSKLARERRRWGVGRAYWYNWASDYVPGGTGAQTFQYAGLNKVTGNSFTPLPLLRTYARTAARFEGCRKSTHARRCR